MLACWHIKDGKYICSAITLKVPVQPNEACRLVFVWNRWRKPSLPSELIIHLSELSVLNKSLYLLKVKPHDVSRTCFECRSLQHVYRNASSDTCRVCLCRSVAACLNCVHPVPTEAWLRSGSWHATASGRTPAASHRSRWCQPDRRSSPAWCLPSTQWYVHNQGSYSVISCWRFWHVGPKWHFFS